jgi:hypothetical protein
MQRVTARLVQALRVAADQQYLYLRLDGPELVRRLLAAEVELALLEDQPKAQRLVFRPAQSGYDAGPRWRAEEVVTAAVPFAVLGGDPGDSIHASLLITDRAGHVLEQHPSQPLVVVAPTPWHYAENWTV